MCFLNWLGNCILYQCPVTGKSTIDLGTLKTRKVKIFRCVRGRCCNDGRLCYHTMPRQKGKTETCFLLHHHKGKKKKKFSS